VLVAAPASTPAFGSVEPINNGPPCSSPPPRGDRLDELPLHRGRRPWRRSHRDRHGDGAPFDVNAAPVQKRTTPSPWSPAARPRTTCCRTGSTPTAMTSSSRTSPRTAATRRTSRRMGRSRTVRSAASRAQGRTDRRVGRHGGRPRHRALRHPSARHDRPVTNSDHVVTQVGRTVTVSRSRTTRVRQ
jgi:hypothetical protein